MKIYTIKLKLFWFKVSIKQELKDRVLENGIPSKDKVQLVFLCVDTKKLSFLYFFFQLLDFELKPIVVHLFTKGGLSELWRDE